MKINDLTPMMETEDIKQTIKFYTEVLGFECLNCYPDFENACWTCLRKDKIHIMFSIRNAHTNVEKTIMTGSLYLYPDNIDEAWQQLKDKVTIEYPIENFDYGMREFAIRDCNGYLLQFGKEI